MCRVPNRGVAVLSSMRKQSRSMVRRTPPLISCAGLGVNADQASGEFVAADPDQKADDQHQERAQHERVLPVALARAKQKHGEHDHLNATKANMPPREPERKMLPAIRAAMPATAIWRFPFVKRRGGQHQGEGREHLHEAGVMIVIDVGAIDRSRPAPRAQIQ